MELVNLFKNIFYKGYDGIPFFVKKGVKTP